MDTAEMAQKRVSLVTTIIACASTFLVSVGGSVAWATQFQTKAAASAQSSAQVSRLERVEGMAGQASGEVSGLREDVRRIDDTTQRLDDKLDKVLMRLSVRR
jgi:hypothetical protein